MSEALSMPHDAAVPHTSEQQRVRTLLLGLVAPLLMTPDGYTLFRDGPLCAVTFRGPEGVLEGVGMVDTGCGFSAVHASDAERLGCQPVAQQWIYTMGGAHLVPTYSAVLEVQGGARVTEVRGLDLEFFRRDMKRADVIAVVGRDVLAQCQFTYDGRGRFKLEVF